MNFIHVSLGTSLEKMPSTLTTFLAWLIDDKSFEKANEPHVMSKEKLRKVLGLVESIVSVARCTFTPFHLGLAIELYHEYGSRTLIETLFLMGFVLHIPKLGAILQVYLCMKWRTWKMGLLHLMVSSRCKKAGT
jgi:hypothetical protein